MKQIYCKISVVLIILLISAQSASSQSLRDRYFSGYGISMFDYFEGPLLLNSDSSSATANWHISLVGLSFNPRLNLLEFGKNASFSLNTPITVGAGVGEGFGSVAINIPATINLNIGNVSTYNSDANKGFTLGAGVEAVYLTKPLLMFDEDYNEGKSYWFQPVANIGYRFWNRENHANEINLKIGYGTSSVDVIKNYYYSSSEVVTRTANTVAFRLSYVSYLNY